MEDFISLFLFLSLVALCILVNLLRNLFENIHSSREAKLNIKRLEKENYDRECKKFVALNKEYEEKNAHLTKSISDFKNIAQQGVEYYPALAAIMADLETLYYERSAKFLASKPHPAFTESKRIQELRVDTQRILAEKKLFEYKLLYITKLYPQLNGILSQNYNVADALPLLSAPSDYTVDHHNDEIDRTYDELCKANDQIRALKAELEKAGMQTQEAYEKLRNANDQILSLKAELERANAHNEESDYAASISIEEHKNYLDSIYVDSINKATFEERQRNQRALSEWISRQNDDAPLIPQNFIDKYSQSMLSDRLDKAVFDEISVSSQLSISCTISSGDNTYTTSLTSCTCPDHTIRHVVCKHMLALAAYVHAFTPYEGNINDLLDDIICNKQILTENRISNEKALQENKKIIKALEEKQQTYPYLAELIANYRAAKINARVRDPSTKRELISHIKTLEKEKAMMQNQIAVYEYMFPILHDFKEVPPQNLEKAIANADGTGFQYQWLSPDEYAALTSHEKQQRWIDRYFRGRSNNAWEAGIKYERYIGYLCESEGYRVKYSGALLKLNDMGRDLIVSKGKKIYIIQCKRFSDSKEIHENHLFQLFGSVTHYATEHPDKNVVGVFVTSAALSPVASECAKSLSILCFEHISFKEYPIIKCNISRNGEKIYHLPFDQQYDTITIEASKGESYVSTVEEAEANGYRHAMRHLFSN